MSSSRFVENYVAKEARKNFIYTKPTIKVDVDLTQQQYDALGSLYGTPEAREQFMYYLGGARRSGKTSFLAYTVCMAEIEQPRGDILLASIDNNKIISLLKKPIEDLSNKWGLGFRWVGGKDPMIITPLGNRIFFKSLKDKKIVDWARGEKFKLTVVDEAQSITDRVLVTFIDDVVEPALQDYGGKVILSGTPSIVHLGFWWDWANNPNNGVHKIVLTPEGNTFLAQDIREKFLDSVRLRRGLTKGKEDAKFKREYRGEWVKDDRSLIFPYDSKVNNFIECPIPPEDRIYAIGCDIGYDDSDAFAVFCYSMYSDEVYLIDEVKRSGQDITSTKEMLQELCRKYGNPVVCFDTGGLGKKIGVEFFQRYGINIIPAEKSDKGGNLRIMQANLKRGKLKIRQGGYCEEEMRLTQWNDTETDFDSTFFHPDMIDAALYGFRYVCNYANLAKKEEKKLTLVERHIQDMESEAEGDFEGMFTGHPRDRRGFA